MKSCSYTLILLFALTGCAKKVDNTAMQNMAITTTIGFDIKDQHVKVSLNSTTLTMNYMENIALLVKADEFQSSWAIIFNQDFSQSQLAKFNYTTVTKAGATVTNYLESNLNNVVITSKTDTLISGIHFIKTAFNRSIVFSNTYATADDANNEYAYLMANKDVIGFSSYITSATGNSPTTSTQNVLIYKN